MAYCATFLPYLLFASVAVAAALITHLLARHRVISSCIMRGVIGSSVGFVVAPVVSALTGIIPDVMLQAEYFTGPLLGCISPWAIFLLYATTAVGVLAGFAGGFWFGHIREQQSYLAILLLVGATGCQTFDMSREEWKRQQKGQYENTPEGTGVATAGWLLYLSSPFWR